MSVGTDWRTDWVTDWVTAWGTIWGYSTISSGAGGGTWVGAGSMCRAAYGGGGAPKTDVLGCTSSCQLNQKPGNYLKSSIIAERLSMRQVI